MKPRVLEHEVTGEGDPIVLVPGILTGWLSWIQHAERLAKTRRVVRVQPIHSELAAHGALPEPEFDPATERDSLLATIDHLGIGRADFAGWSGGGRALIEFAAAYPERIRTLTLVEPAAYWILEQAHSFSADEIDGLMRRLANRPVTEDELVEFLTGPASMLPPDSDPRSDPRWPVWTANRNALASDFVLARPDRPLADLKALEAPVLLVLGSNTKGFLVDVVTVLEQTYPNVRRVMLPGDHACHIQSIDRFLEELTAHIASAPSPMP
jgi:pimeloyl-ACP methyl ester carboxylesterase